MIIFNFWIFIYIFPNHEKILGIQPKYMKFQKFSDPLL